MLTDEGRCVAKKAAQQGVKVVWEQWEAMPHCFSLVLLGSPMSKRSFKDWSEFCTKAVKGRDKEAEVETQGLWFEARTGREVEMDVKSLDAVGDEEVTRRMRDARGARFTGREGEAKLLPKL